MERNFYSFRHGDATLHYSVYGTGPVPLLCFHGFGVSGQIFYELEEVLAKRYTIYNFDIFYHGKSTWEGGEKPLTSILWKEWMNAFRKENNIGTFSLLGYSIGARLVWHTGIHFSKNIKEIIVMAPDGVINSIWYRLATGSRFGLWLFRRLLAHAPRMETLLNMGKKLRLVPFATARFAGSQLSTAEQRERVFHTWSVFRKLGPVNEKLAEEINRLEIDTTFFLGVHDRIITQKTIQPLVEKLKHKNILSLQAGHTNLVKVATRYLKTLLLRS
jgi:pimeloyl-ACP methyl ester carboxylesterase